LVVSGPARCLLRITACRLAKSPKATLYIRGSGNFVTSVAAPIASGWSEPVPGRGFQPAVDQRLSRRTDYSLPIGIRNVSVRLSDRAGAIPQRRIGCIFLTLERLRVCVSLFHKAGVSSGWPVVLRRNGVGGDCHIDCRIPTRQSLTCHETRAAHSARRSTRDCGLHVAVALPSLASSKSADRKPTCGFAPQARPDLRRAPGIDASCAYGKLDLIFQGFLPAECNNVTRLQKIECDVVDSVAIRTRCHFW
jgi:hypothetical protein